MGAPASERSSDRAYASTAWYENQYEFLASDAAAQGRPYNANTSAKWMVYRPCKTASSIHLTVFGFVGSLKTVIPSPLLPTLESVSRPGGPKLSSSNPLASKTELASCQSVTPGIIPKKHGRPSHRLNPSLVKGFSLSWAAETCDELI